MVRLLDCVDQDPQTRELLVFSSARLFDLAKLTRNRISQALLLLNEAPIPNENTPFDEVIDDDEFKWFVSTLGVGLFLNPPDERLEHLERLRYDRIILATDDSPSGEHVGRQVKTWLRLYLRPVFEGGHVYDYEVSPSPTISGTELDALYLGPSRRALRVLLAAGS